jgi:hypothetical protein
MESIPDQYIDALAIDYATDRLVVGARCHGNNTENFWEGNTIANDPQAYGFQNNFTGTNGNIHISWLGKLRLNDGVLTNSTYMAELAEGTGQLGTPHPDPNLDGWPDPNTGWPDVNTTRLSKNSIKVSSSGDVCVLAVGRRTITTANAYQKMVKPNNGGLSCWNSFVRVYDSQFHAPKYSSLVVGAWDTLTQQGGDNTELFGMIKTAGGVVCVGRQKADSSGIATGNDLPVINVPPWGNNIPQNESAILVYYQAANLFNANDSTGYAVTAVPQHTFTDELNIYPNPASANLFISSLDVNEMRSPADYFITNAFGEVVQHGILTESMINVNDLSNGLYLLHLVYNNKIYNRKICIIR